MNMKDLLEPTKMLNDAIDSAKMRVKASILKIAKVKENDIAFVSWRAGWQITFAITSKQDALKVIAVAVANDFKIAQNPMLEVSKRYYEVSIDLDEHFILHS